MGFFDFLKNTEFFKDAQRIFHWSRHLCEIDRFHLPDADENFVNRIVEYSIQNRGNDLPKEENLYRARVNPLDKRTKLDLAEMGAPPRDRARAGRMNPVGIPYLYLASDQMTAIAEVRPWMGAHVSVARFTPRKDLRIVNLSNHDAKPEMKKAPRGEPRDFFNFLMIMSMTVARPHDPNDELSYIPTQYFAEKFKRQGLDGLMYPSVLRKGGSNIVLFDTTAAEAKEVSLHRIDEVTYVAKDENA